MDHTDDELIREVQNQAETRLQALQDIAIAADTRSIQFGLACVAIAAVVVTIGGQAEIPLPGYTASAIFITSAAISFLSGQPAGWYPPGNSPKQFRNELESGVPTREVRLELLGHYDAIIAENSQLLERNGQLFRFAMRLAWSAPFAAAIAHFLPSFLALVCS